MKPWPVWAILAGCVFWAGCRTDPNIVLLERELRLQEDRIYQLEDYIDEYEEMLESCRRELATLRRQLKNQQYLLDSEPVPPGGATLPRAVTEPARRSGTKPSGGMMPVTPPNVELPDTTIKPPEGPRGPARPPADAQPDKQQSEPPLYRPEPVPNGAGAGYRAAEVAGRVTQVPGPMLPGLGESVGEPATAEERSPHAEVHDSSKVAKIVINPLLTGAYNKRRSSASEGVMVVLEPRDADGKLVEAPAEVSIAVVDPALEGPAGRIARWDFAAEEIARRFRNTIAGRAIELEMPWPGAPPQNERLHLFVRYITSDGRKLHADRPIRVNPPLEVLERPEPNAADDTPQPPITPNAQSNLRDDRWQSAPSATATTSPQHRPAQRGASATIAAGYQTTASQPSTAADPHVMGISEVAHPAARDQTWAATGSEALPRLRRPVWTPDRR